MKLKLNGLLLLTVFLCFANPAFTQGNRINTGENIGWYNVLFTLNLSEKTGAHIEYQWRRDRFISKWQQSLLRLGVNYQISPKVLLRVGYANIETFPYGEIPLNALGRRFTEHRAFQMVQLSHKEGIVEFSHRYMLEQRFIGRYSSATATTEDEFPRSNRFRYMFRMQAPLKGKEIKDKTPYVAVYDEVFIGFGKNVTVNTFDQNRIGVLLGYRVDKNVRIEGGYVNQILQFGRQINGRNVFQNNNGVIVNANFTIDLFKR